MKLRIFITQNILEQSKYCGTDINNSNEMIGQNCAIGRAIFALFGTHSYVETDSISINLDRPIAEATTKELNGCLQIPLPDEAKDFIQAFDDAFPQQRAEMPPFSFEIDVPQVVVDKLGLDYMQNVIKREAQLELVDS